MAALRKGEITLADPAARIALAEQCVRPRRFPLVAVGCYAEAFTADAKLAEDLQSQHRYHATCCAVLVGMGRGEDAEALEERQRARWRKQALAWLRAELAQWTEPGERSSPPDQAAVRQTLARWQRDPALAGLRDPAALSQLPADEQQAWKRFWDEVTTRGGGAVHP